MPGIEFTEVMRGYFSTQIEDDYDEGYRRGRTDDSPLEVELTITADDLERLLGEEREGRIEGTVSAPALSEEPLTVTDGVFSLFTEDPALPESRKMRYRFEMRTNGGESYYFDGVKHVRDDPGFDLWSDTTTLYVTIYEGPEAETPIVGKGRIEIGARELVDLLRSMRVIGAESARERMDALATFGRAFAGTLYDTYGDIFGKPTVFDPDAPPREKRPLRVGTPEVHFITTSDDVRLKLTRYNGGEKGPVMLVHGLGVSSKIFSTDLIETNLLEYLYERDYDVWLFDNRVSSDYPTAEQFSTADDVAQKDYPPAVDEIRAVTGRDSIQAVVHCYGSVTFFMSLLAGLEGIRSVVSSQVATHQESQALSKLKAGLYLPDVLDGLGIDTLTAYVDTDTGWRGRFLDNVLRFYPYEGEERCDSSVCHRITFLYGHLYEHDQLNARTHEHLHELFGVANVGAFEHLALMLRRGHVVSADGDNVYLPHPERLALPITFIHGGENACFIPESTERTYSFLREHNDPEFYRREIIPDYGHIDCIFGKNAVNDVYPSIVEHLDETQNVTLPA
jgi:cholesterol oxidase